MEALNHLARRLFFEKNVIAFIGVAKRRYKSAFLFCIETEDDR